MADDRPAAVGAGDARAGLDSSSAAARAVQLGATILLGGGFYFGFVRQQRLARKEKLAPSKKTKHAPPVIRQATMLERGLRLDRPQSPGMAAFKALLGGTAVSVSGCALIVFGVSSLLGVGSLEEFRDRVEKMLPRNKAPPRLLPSEQRNVEFATEEDELNHIAAIFQEAIEEEVREQRRAKK